jgi:hypothetical protein
VRKGPLPRDRAVSGAGNLVALPALLATALSSSDRTLLRTTFSFLSSRAQPRDLQFPRTLLGYVFREQRVERG